MSGKVRRWGDWQATEAAFARGGQGHVYRVQDTTGRHVGCFVLKELLNPKRSARFINEIKAITELPSHSHIIDVVDFGAYKDSQKPTYVMPEADCSLEGYVHERKGSISVLECLELFQKIVSGVEHLHANGIIHRDIKPDNVLMFSGEPKVSDFGLCLITDLPRVTPTEEAVGPRYYMAPELEDGRYLKVDYSADIYSLGKVLYFLLSEGMVFSREKFNLPHWNLSTIRGDERFNIFKLIFEKTIVEPVYQRMTCSELMLAVLEVQEKYLGHPLTSLEKKLPKVLTSFDGALPLLAALDELEWIEFLKIRKKHDAIWSESIGSLALQALTKQTAELFADEIIRGKAEIDKDQMMLLAAKLVSVYDGFFMSNSKFNYFLHLAVNAPGSMGVNAAANIFNLREPEILSKVALRVAELEPKSLVNFMMRTSSVSYPGRENMLLEVSRNSRVPNVLGFTVAGLMHEGSDDAIDRVAELFRDLSSIDEVPEMIQGLALSRESQPNMKKLLGRGGYTKSIEAALRIMSDISAEVVQDLERKEEEKREAEERLNAEE
jgi:serine/threonine protein kinase